MAHLVEHVRLRELSLEVRRAGQDQPLHVHLVLRNETLHHRLGHLSHVVVPLLQTQTRESQCRLTAAACAHVVLKHTVYTCDNCRRCQTVTHTGHTTTRTSDV